MSLPRSIAGIRDALRVLRTVLGAPDYQRYCEHMRKVHPNAVALGEREFMDQRLSERYERPGSRCC